MRISLSMLADLLESDAAACPFLKKKMASLLTPIPRSATVVAEGKRAQMKPEPPAVPPQNILAQVQETPAALLYKHADKICCFHTDEYDMLVADFQDKHGEDGFVALQNIVGSYWKVCDNLGGHPVFKKDTEFILQELWQCIAGIAPPL